MRSRRHPRCAPARASSLALLLLSLGGVPAFAQNATTGAIRGRLTGSEGSAVSAAQVSAVNEATGFTRQVVSGDNGDYAALMLPPGRYSLRVQRLGFRPLTRDRVLVHIGDVATIAVALAATDATLEG